MPKSSSMYEKAVEALKKVVDPEVGVNVVDLGLIYELKPENDRIYVKMTLTSPFCPLGGLIIMGVEQALKAAGFKKVDVDVVFDPPWTPERMSEEAKRKLGWKDEGKGGQK